MDAVEGAGVSQDFPVFTNLTTLAESLAGGVGYKIRQALKQAWRVQSCLGDLRQSQDCCDNLRTVLKRPRSEDTPELLTVERALLTTAVTLYVRATSTGAQKGDRGSIQLDRKSLTNEQWDDHQRLIDVRNQALAHVRSSEIIADHTWHRELFFAVKTDGQGWKPASASNQTGFHAETLNRLERALPSANAALMRTFDKRMSAVAALINASDVPESAMLSHVFDPVSVFGSVEAVQHILAGQKDRTASLWVNE